MSAVYLPKHWDAAYAAAFQEILAYIEAHPGDSLDAIATGTSQPYAVVYAVCQAAGCIVLPSASGELQWHAHK